MLKTGKVICPTCGGEVVEFDNLDIEVDTSTVTLFKVGECDHCGNHYQWHEEYTLAGYRDLEQSTMKARTSPMTSNADSTPTQVAILTTAEKQSFVFGAPPTFLGSAKFHYNTASAICQMKNVK